MHCYFCDLDPPSGGVRMGDRRAIGRCEVCNAAVCELHGRLATAELELLCYLCATALNVNNRLPVHSLDHRTLDDNLSESGDAP
jgi:hypothetical protein